MGLKKIHDLQNQRKPVYQNIVFAEHTLNPAVAFFIDF